jgi:N-acetyl-1-D-myo-inositol-2-amino-2-deoxy-alpha-D-glucopyranoside deacetylase
MAQLRMLACFAHPDDEAFTASGVLAASTARGVQVRLVCATCGEEGDIRQPGVATRETLGKVRHEELRRSCQVLSLQEPIMLGYRDSGWGDSPAQYHPDAFVQAPPLQVVRRLVEEIRRFKPHIVLTFEPDGVSGHKDYKAISRHTTAAVHAAGDSTAFPEQMHADLFPHHPPRLFYVARLQGHRMHRATLLRQAGLEVPLPDPELRPQGVPLEQLHVRLDVTPYLEQKLASMRSHRTQMTPDWTFDKVPWDTTVAILGQEYLMRAHPSAQPGEPLAADFLESLLAGERVRY